MAGKLMVIDDEHGITRVIGLVARHLGLEFEAVTNPLEAVERYAAWRPDILILDMIMPEKDGLDVLHEILQTGIRSRIILTSGYGDSYLKLAQGVARFHEANAPTLLGKPFRRQQLIEMLMELTDRGEQLTC